MNVWKQQITQLQKRPSRHHGMTCPIQISEHQSEITANSPQFKQNILHTQRGNALRRSMYVVDQDKGKHLAQTQRDGQFTPRIATQCLTPGNLTISTYREPGQQDNMMNISSRSKKQGMNLPILPTDRDTTINCDTKSPKMPTTRIGFT